MGIELANPVQPSGLKKSTISGQSRPTGAQGAAAKTTPATGTPATETPVATTAAPTVPQDKPTISQQGALAGTAQNSSSTPWYKQIFSKDFWKDILIEKKSNLDGLYKKDGGGYRHPTDIPLDHPLRQNGNVNPGQPSQGAQPAGGAQPD